MEENLLKNNEHISLRNAHATHIALDCIVIHIILHMSQYRLPVKSHSYMYIYVYSFVYMTSRKRKPTI